MEISTLTKPTEVEIVEVYESVAESADWDRTIRNPASPTATLVQRMPDETSPHACHEMRRESSDCRGSE
jgi:hypothetical protein